jgi:ATP-dependent helicase HrpA
MDSVSAPPDQQLAELRGRLAGLTLRDAARLERRLHGHPRNLAPIAEQVSRGESLVARRRAALPLITYPEQLPVSQRRAAIADAIRDHQVVVIAGETGSGKTTQLPKICLELGRGIRGTIGHTQPRRLAARTVAERIAEELSVPLGGAVGYSVRFTDQAGEDTLVRLMTDGILLAEIQRDRLLLRYDTIIIDEAHERSLNIDFLLGYLARLLPKRPDLKVIITSATIDPQRFADHFGGAPVVEVSGRSYPVEVRYRPLSDVPDGKPQLDQTEGIIAAIHELALEPAGDVLVFLTGEREIRDTADALRALELPNTEVLPLYARLAAAEQHRVWQPHPGRRIVLATNVAETSLTVPGIRYVIDPGSARISRFSKRTKVQRLPIEDISQASANQRAGRCGRVADGVCIRLYSESDFASRPLFTDPEILRTNLASVILQMAALGLGEVADFGFLDPPDARSINDGVLLLHELGALDDSKKLTPTGRQVAQLPVDPRIARMIVEAGRQGCVREVLVIAAALSIPDPRERPLEQQQAADASHARFVDPTSDFLTLLNLWNYLRTQRADLSGNQFRRMCREEFLHYLRVREWQDLRGQLRQIARGLDLTESDQPADAGRVHAALAAGLLSHLGMRVAESREYLGARNVRFMIAPGSVLARKPPRWVIAAELVETHRLLARTVARIEPESLEEMAGHLVVRSYSEPTWDAKRGSVTAIERVSLYGLPLVVGRRTSYAKVDPIAARELFIRHALVEGDWQTHHRFFAHNRDLLAEIDALEERGRRRDLLVGEEELFAFYDARIPSDVVSAQHFDSWWKGAHRATPDLLMLSRADVVRPEALAQVERHDLEAWQLDGLELPLTYRFDPGSSDDGVTVHVPLDVLARLGGADFSWQVPALREELIIALIRSLPKNLRRNFVPVPDTARAVLASIEPGREPLLDALQRELHRRTGVLVAREEFDFGKLPPHLRLGFAVEDEGGEVIARGHDLTTLQQELAAPVQLAVSSIVAPELERRGLQDWPAELDVVPQLVEQSHGGHVVRGYPAFVDAGSQVELRVFATRAEQEARMANGVRRLLRLTLPSPLRAVAAGRSARSKLLLATNPDGSVPELVEDCADAAIDELLTAVPWSREEFLALREYVRGELTTRTAEAVADVERVLAAAQPVRAELPTRAPAPLADSVADMRAQLDSLLYKGFVTSSGSSRMRDLNRYVTAIGRRLERLPRDVDLDRALMQRVHTVENAYEALRKALPDARASMRDVTDIGWQLQELRVSLFAQQLGTPRPISEKRIYRALDAITP